MIGTMAIGFLYVCGAARQYVAVHNEEVLLSSIMKRDVKMIPWQSVLSAVFWPITTLLYVFLMAAQSGNERGWREGLGEADNEEDKDAK